jgi:serine/threonine-protein kinase HipA
MSAAALTYFLGATDAHAKNYSLLYARGAQRPSLRLAPFYDIASAWPYARRIPPQKMKLAMRVGRHIGFNRSCRGIPMSSRAHATTRPTG